MDGIMHGSIDQVAQYETRKESEGILPKYQVFQPKNSRGQDDAGHRRHEQPVPVTGVMMVIAMHDINKFLGFIAIGHPVKGVPVRQVFKKGPEEHACKEQQGDLAATESAVGKSINRQTNDKWKINAPDHQWISLGKHFQVRILEKLRLALIMNFLKLHQRWIYGKFTICLGLTNGYSPEHL